MKLLLVINVADDVAENYKGFTVDYDLRGMPIDNENVNESIKYVEDADVVPLPKGHGDLIDRKELIENGLRKGFCDWYDEIKMADAIIESDR